MGSPADPTGAVLAGHVVALSLHPPRSAPEQVATVQALAGCGLAKDRHASNASPRQVLIASSNAYAAQKLPPMTLRENVLVDFNVAGIRSGDLLRIGVEVELVAMFTCEPCGRLEAHGAGLSTRIGDERGVLARVVRAGEMRCGDAVRLAPAVHTAWSNDWRERVARVLSLVPPDRWVTFSQLAELAGVAPGYCRAFPRLLSSLPDSLEKRARPAGSHKASGAPWNGEGLHDRFLVHDGSSVWN